MIFQRMKSEQMFCIVVIVIIIIVIIITAFGLAFSCPL